MNRVTGRSPRRRFCAGILAGAAGLTLGCAASGAPAATDSASTPPPAAPQPAAHPLAPPSTGKLLVSGNGNFYTFDLASRQATQVTHYPKDSFGAAPALSPDRKRVAYTYYVLPTSIDDLGGSDLYVMDVDSLSPQVILSAKKIGGSFESPCWSSDGKSVDATVRVTQNGSSGPAVDQVSVYRIPLDGSKPIKLADRAQSPTLSVDGASLAYLGATTNDI